MSAARLRAAFRKYDKNRDGTIDAEELCSVLKAIGGGFSDAEVEAVFQTVDANGDGRLQYTEFVRWLEYGSNSALGEKHPEGAQSVRQTMRKSIEEDAAMVQAELESRARTSNAGRTPRNAGKLSRTLEAGAAPDTGGDGTSSEELEPDTGGPPLSLPEGQDGEVSPSKTLGWSPPSLSESNVLKMKMRADCVLLPPDKIKAPIEENLLPFRRERGKGRETQELIRLGLMQDPLCAMLRRDELDAILDTMEFCEFSSGDAVVRQGEVGSGFFVLHSGLLDVTVNDQKVNTISRGACFGGIALRCKCPRTATVTAAESASCWVADGSKFQQVLRENAERQRQENRELLDSVSAFASLSTQAKDYIGHHLFVQHFEGGAVLASEGEPASAVFIVKSGALKAHTGGEVQPSGLYVGGREVSQLAPGEACGAKELFSVEGVHKSTLLVSSGPCELLCISGEALKEILGGGTGGTFAERKLVLAASEKSQTLSRVPLAQLGALIGAARWRRYDGGKALPDSPPFTVVLEGQLQLFAPGEEAGTIHSQMTGATKPEKTLHKGQWHESYRRASSADQQSMQPMVAGLDGCKCAHLSKTLIQEALQAVRSNSDGHDIEYSTTDPLRVRAMMKKVPALKHLSQEQTEKLVRSFALKHYNEDDYVIQQGDLGTAFYVIARGQVYITINGKQVRTMTVNDAFGERALLFDELRTASAQVSAGGAEIWCLNKATFLEVVQSELQLHHMKERIKLQDTNVNISDLQLLKTIGAGHTGVVSLAEHKDTKMQYALKRMGRTDKIREHIEREKSLLVTLSHPFIVGFVTTAESSQSLYTLTEYVKGEDLYCILRRFSRALSKDQAQIYAGSLLLVLEELRNHNILHRDLKPENIMVDQHGYIKVVDFGVAKSLADETRATYTIVGTPHYTAPEVLIGRGYGLGVDNWSLGIMLFEFLCACLPFGDIMDEPADICKAVCQDPLEFPQFFRDKDGGRLIVGLLRRKRASRLGAGSRGLEEIKAAPFFQTGQYGAVLFDRIQSRSVKPPFLPDGIEPAESSVVKVKSEVEPQDSAKRAES